MHSAANQHTAAKQPSGQAQLDIAGLNLGPKEEEIIEEEPPKAAIALDKLLEQVKAELATQGKAEKRGLSLVVIGMVDSSYGSSELGPHGIQGMWTLESLHSWEDSCMSSDVWMRRNASRTNAVVAS